MIIYDTCNKTKSMQIYKTESFMRVCLIDGAYQKKKQITPLSRRERSSESFCEAENFLNSINYEN